MRHVGRRGADVGFEENGDSSYAGNVQPFADTRRWRWRCLRWHRRVCNRKRRLWLVQCRRCKWPRWHRLWPLPGTLSISPRSNCSALLRVSDATRPAKMGDSASGADRQWGLVLVAKLVSLQLAACKDRLSDREVCGWRRRRWNFGEPVPAWDLMAAHAACAAAMVCATRFAPYSLVTAAASIANTWVKASTVPSACKVS